MTNEERMKRWRLILGSQSQETFDDMGGISLTEEQWLMDQALAAIYGLNEGFEGERGSGNGPSAPRIARWLGDLRTLFDKDLVTVIQNDAIERKGLKQLLLEPEMLEHLEPDIQLASTLLALKDHIPKRSKESARKFIEKIVEEVNRLLENDIRRAVTATLNKRRHSSIPSASAIDFPYTIRRNLKHYSPALGTVIPERVYFFDRMAKSNRWHVILDVDQSGSMGESVIYSSIMACILASMSAIKTNVVAFDTQIMDLTEKCEDPVDLLFGFQLGGGTDINKSIAYCQQLIETPGRTLFFLISDLEEGGNRGGMLRRIEDMKASGVTVICLLAIADGGRPYYDQHTAQRIAALGVPVFACAPQKLPDLLERAFSGHDLAAFAADMEKREIR